MSWIGRLHKLAQCLEIALTLIRFLCGVTIRFDQSLETAWKRRRKAREYAGEFSRQITANQWVTCYYRTKHDQCCSL